MWPLSSFLNGFLIFFMSFSLSQAQWTPSIWYTPEAVLFDHTSSKRSLDKVDIIYYELLRQCRSLVGSKECASQLHALRIALGALSTAEAALSETKQKKKDAKKIIQYKEHVRELTSLVHELEASLREGDFSRQEKKRPVISILFDRV